MLAQKANGRELLFYNGMRVAAACGVAPELLKGLEACVTPSADETRH
jgi:hypothetical protein